MEIYFSPEIIESDHQILNIVNQDHQAVGYLTFLFNEKKMYIYGQLENEGVSNDFEDLIKPYIEGMAKAKELEVYSYLSIGGKKLDLQFSNDKKN